MKKQSIFLLFSTLVVLTFFSCTSKTIKTKEKDFSKRYFLSSDTTKGSLNVTIQVEFPVSFKDKVVLDSIRTTIITNIFGKSYVSHPNDSINELFANDLNDDYVDNNQPLVNQLDSGSAYSFNNEQTVSGFSLLSDKKIYVYGIERYVYMGGAHGMETRNYYNFDLKNGKLITESDLFKENYKAELSDLIKKRIVEESKETNEKDPILNLEDTDYWTDSIKPNGNFYITDEGVNYVFNPYEIAPYSLGQTEVTLPFNRLKEIFRPDNIITYLIKKQPKQ